MISIWQKNGVTSLVLREYIPDKTSVFGEGKTGLAYSSSGLVVASIADNEASATVYTQAAGNIETIATLGTFAAPSAGKCRFREVDATYFPGLYEIQMADARWAVSGARYVDISLPGVAGLGTAPRRVRVQLTAVDPQDATRFGLAALPNAAAGASGGLPVGDPLAQDVPGDYASGTAGYKLGLLGSGAVTVVSPLDALSLDLEIVRGDDYTASSGRALPEWSSEDWTPFGLTSAESVTLRARARYGETVFEAAAAAVSDTLVRVELTSAETGALAVGRAAYRYDLEAILATGDVVTLAQGHISVIEDVQ